jgi:hypothetical protein
MIDPESQRAAKQGDAHAQCQLGHMYMFGMGVPKEDAEAMKWYQKAAQQGNASAQLSLGVMYATGQGVPRNYAEAVKWVQKAAEQGNPYAQFTLGGMYERGDGVPQDVAKAVELYRMAAEQGDDDAQFRLGIIYEGGRGVPKDLSAAAEWFRKAADRGHIEAGAGLREVLSEMDREKNAHNEDAKEEGAKETAQGLRYPGVACNYALIRFLPYPDSEEFVNIGIVLSCPKTGYFNARLEQQQFSRISTLFPEIKREVIQNVIDFFAKEMERFCVKISSHSDAQEQLPRKQELSRHFFSEVVRPRESVVRCSEPRTGMAEEPEALLDALFERYVERLHAQEELRRNEETEDEGEEEIQSYRTKL